MRITKARLDRYRKDLDSLGESASRYVEALFDGLIAEHPGASVAEMREAADEAIQDSLYAFGDQASSLALDLFDEIAEAYGIPVVAALPTLASKPVRWMVNSAP